MHLSVIIPTFNRRDTLAVCLEHLDPKIQNVSPDLFEVIVTDDGADDETLNFLARDFPWVRHTRGPHKGPASNRNNGASAATGDWLIFLDDDCFPQPGFLSAYMTVAQNNPGFIVFEGSTLPESPRARLDEEAPINEKGGYLWSCNFMVKRMLFVEMGGFCELYPYACMEDVDFREQLKARNIKFLFAPGASVIHPWRALAPEEKFLNMQLVSHDIFYQRYPLLKPTFIMSCRAVIRGWVVGLIVEPLQLGFRGFARHLARQSTLAHLNYMLSQDSLAGHSNRKVPQAPAPTRSS